MKEYKHRKIENKIQQEWEKVELFKADFENKEKKKFYLLDMFPYPSGDGLHMGHTEQAAITDTLFRFERMKGKNVLHPQGFDAFGLPAENYAIKTKIHPAETIEKTTKIFQKQIDNLGLGYDFLDGAVNTTNPNYYKHTQWLFAKFFENDIAYKKTAKANWCESCKTVIATEQMENGNCERCGTEIEQKEIPSWMFRITNFADDLIWNEENEKKFGKVDWPEHTKKNQNAWIGKSEGAKIKFPIDLGGDEIKKDVLLLHGWDGGVETDFFPWLRNLLKGMGYNVFLFNQPNTESPNFDEWFSFIEDKIKENNLDNFSLLGHSMGGHLALKLSEKYKINDLFLIAPVGFEENGSKYFNQFENTLSEDELTIFKNYQNRKLNIEKVKENTKRIHFIFGKNDTWINSEIRKYYIDNFGDVAKIDILEEYGHMSEDEGVKEVEEIGGLFDIETDLGGEIEVFTTRPDTLFGATYMVLAPEHNLVQDWKNQIENLDEVEKYISDTKKKTELDRLEGKEKTGVELKGVKAVNPANQEELPIFISDYVLAGYGTGAIMAVPAHDERDNEFAKKFGIEIRDVVAPSFIGKNELAPRDEVETLNRRVVDIIIEREDGKILLEKDTHWHFVGGGVEEGENDEEAVRKEIIEETGYLNFKIEKKFFDNEFGLAYRETKNKNQKTRGAWYYVKLINEEQQKSEVDEGRHIIEWFDKKEVAKKIEWEWHLFAWKIFYGEIFYGNGILVNSGEFDGTTSEEAKKKITEFVGGELTSTYRLRDWSISRQRYWGTPIPIVYDPQGKAHYVGDENLPWTLPTDVDFVPTGTAPFAKSVELKERVEKIFGKGWTPEVDTMDTFVDSSWYFLRYPDPQNDKEFSSEERLKKWMPVDLYIGGAEHTYMHLLFARFFVKAMKKIGLVDFDEPFLKLRHQGMILDKKGVKMSKSKGNVVNPDEMVERFGADATRAYMLFAGPVEDDKMWNEDNIVGIYRFIEKVWRQQEKLTDEENLAFKKELHKTIKKVSQDTEDLKFNTAISEMMKLMNFSDKEKNINKNDYLEFIKILSPFAPHVAEEIWREQGGEGFLIEKDWPNFDEELAKVEKIKLGIQVNGKRRGEIEISPEAGEDEAMELAKNNPEIDKWLGGEIVKVVYVAGRILNLIVK